jgi:hypothetical protein
MSRAFLGGAAERLVEFFKLQEAFLEQELI